MSTHYTDVIQLLVMPDCHYYLPNCLFIVTLD